MHFRIDPQIFKKYPNLCVGLLVCRGINNAGSSSDVALMLRAEESTLRSQYVDPELLKEHPIIAAWQEVHRSFGSNPNKFPSSIHALTKRVVKGAELPAISPLVDLYNVISLRYMIPAGGEDLDACVGNIQLTTADGTETFTTLGDETNDPPEAGEIVYKDEEGVMCRKFNWREAARTALQPKTRNALLVLEAIPPFKMEQLEVALSSLKELVDRVCGGNSTIHVLSKSNSSIEV